MQEQGKQNFLKGAAILAAAQIFVKIVGAIYKIPIANVLDDEGRGSFSVTYDVYTLLLTISTAGIPAALSRLVSTANAKGKTSLVRRYFSVALPSFIVIGAIAMLIMFVFAQSFANLMNDSLAAPGVRVLAPAVFFACIISVYRGYAQGFENMIPTAVSQVFEVVSKAVFGLIIAMWLAKMGRESDILSIMGAKIKLGPHIVSAGAIMGVTIGLGLCIPVLIWYKKRLDRKLSESNDTAELPSRFGVFGRIMKVSIPITLSASFMAIMSFVDTSVVLGRLKSSIMLAQGLTEAAAEAQARAMNGIYVLGKNVYNLPLALVVPISVSIIPAIAAALAKNREGEAGVIMQSSVKLVNLLAMPAGAGLMALATPIMIALYNESRQLAATILVILGAASFFACLQYITTAILQANGHERITLMTFPIGAAIKIVIGYLLAGNQNFGIIGSPIGTLCCFSAISTLNIIFIIVKVKERPKLLGVFVKPFLCTSVMAAVAYSAYKLINTFGSGILGTGRFAVIVFLGISILVGVAVYAILIIRTHTVTKEDMLLVPKGEKLVKIFGIK